MKNKEEPFLPCFLFILFFFLLTCSVNKTDEMSWGVCKVIRPHLELSRVYTGKSHVDDLEEGIL